MQFPCNYIMEILQNQPPILLNILLANCTDEEEEKKKKILSKTSDRFSNTECMLHLSCVISLLELCTYTLTHTLTP